MLETVTISHIAALFSQDAATLRPRVRELHQRVVQALLVASDLVHGSRRTAPLGFSDAPIPASAQAACVRTLKEHLFPDMTRATAIQVLCSIELWELMASNISAAEISFCLSQSQILAFAVCLVVAIALARGDNSVEIKEEMQEALQKSLRVSASFGGECAPSVAILHAAMHSFLQSL